MKVSDLYRYPVALLYQGCDLHMCRVVVVVVVVVVCWLLN